ncbi:MAG TPA: universal stress protein [Burkholderiaceae bacterium]|mgnify:CR=1 FL=1|jgi:nucleotide-binding universal stress UspA family protein|nr:universal stress protein [Burkholderiaceae bacterium]
MIQTIVLHLDGSANSATRTELAIAIAREHGSHLIGVAPTGEVAAPIEFGASLVDPGYLIATRQYLRKCAQLLCEAFDAQVAAAALGSHESRVVESGHAAGVLALARAADLTVIGQLEPGAAADRLERDLPEQVVLGCGRPVLVVPYAGRHRVPGRQVLAAWNDSRESAHAFTAALPLLRRAHGITVMTQREAPARPLPTQDLAAWLRRHGVANVRFADEVAPIGVGDLLLSRAADLDADLIVMGAWGQSRLKEWALGGATRSLLQQMTVPVLMAH